ncbi:2OG-Fe(II) oxygenase [Azospirillum picis]|uniref:Peroxiredoxin n=1 Tax=Azospirillum picis TaxID=488438 RepID=A0ABU0MTL2_9PROT|nr:2OG-Fe(II) oxygenase [Azospirillum picis]MBP2303061.1 peroxiredoxin [Azospirillum picis]MDQ0536825.1 peroxiredoxin [Azospirillum picis]
MLSLSAPGFLRPGDPAPWFVAETATNPRFHADTLGGRYILLGFLGSAAAEPAARALAALRARRHLFDDVTAAVFTVSSDPQDRERLAASYPGLRAFRDHDLAVARLYGAAVIRRSGSGDALVYRPHWLLLDPLLRVMATAGLDQTDALLDMVAGLPDLSLHAGTDLPAPVLILPRVFEPDFCRMLIGLYETHGGGESGFMREVDGRTVPVFDHRHKRRSDHTIADPAIRDAARTRIERRVLPEIRKAFQFRVTRMERYIVACYDAAEGGHFRAHRDNTTKGTAHRRFAVSINLNAEEFEGGELCFPEFGPRRYRPPTGGAVVFSCSLLHEAAPVTAGRRYAFLPFLYDEAGARQREANNGFLGEGVGAYRAATPAAEPVPSAPMAVADVTPAPL